MRDLRIEGVGERRRGKPVGERIPGQPRGSSTARCDGGRVAHHGSILYSRAVHVLPIHPRIGRRFPLESGSIAMPTMTMVQAITDALRTAMSADKRVVLLGEDIGKNGGVFRVTEGLQAQFGTDRVMDT